MPHPITATRKVDDPFYPDDYDSFKVTGTDCKGRRNPAITTNSLVYAKGLNYWFKTVWGKERETQRWRKLYEVRN